MVKGNVRNSHKALELVSFNHDKEQICEKGSQVRRAPSESASWLLAHIHCKFGERSAFPGLRFLCMVNFSLSFQPALGMWGSRPALSGLPPPSRDSLIRQGTWQMGWASEASDMNETDTRVLPRGPPSSALDEQPWQLGAGSAGPPSKPCVYLGRSEEASFLMTCLCPH